MWMNLKQDLWGKNYELSLKLPEEWNTSVVYMEGDGEEALRADDYKNVLAPLAHMINGKREICILFDDLSRPTKTHLVLPHLLELFDKCGIRDEQIRFLCATGMHTPLNNAGFRKKLGDDIPGRFPVYNHNPYENCDRIGKSRLGTPVSINKEFLSCDFRIGIGAFIPHSFCGFGGGYKIIMPGISHVETIEYHHGALMAMHREASCVLGKHRDNPLFEDMLECGRMAGLNVKIDVLINTGATPTHIYAGNPEDLYGNIIYKATAHYNSKTAHRADIVFANAYCKANEAVIALSLAETLLKDEGGYVVILCDIEEGQVIHYLLGRFGKSTWGRLAFNEREKNSKVRKIFLYSRFKDKANEFWFGKDEDLVWSDSIDEIVHMLKGRLGYDRADVLVVPDATIQGISLTHNFH